MSAYIRLIVPHKFSPKQVQQWFATVEKNIPSGLIGETTISVDQQSRVSRYYAKRTRKGQYSYVIPLVRNLDASEVHQVLQAWCTVYEQGDFVFDYSQAADRVMPHTLDLAQSKIDQALDAWGKQQHAAWMQEHSAQGWRYGVTVSVKHRIHPWMQPWESLPAAARTKNTQAVKDLLKVLGDFGYTVVQKNVA